MRRLAFCAGMVAVLAMGGNGAAFAEGKPTPTPKPVKTQAARPEIGAVSRSTGHLFREGLASGIIAEGNTAKHATIAPNKFGLLTDAAAGGLGPKLWDGLSAGDLQDMMGHLSPASAWPIAQNLARRLVLTDASWPGGDDLLSLRLQKMMAYGLVDETAHLYAHIAPEDPGTDLLSVAVPALVLSGDRSTACLELQTNDVSINVGKQWRDLDKDAVCRKDEQSPATVKPQTLSDLVPMDLLAVSPGGVHGIDWSALESFDGADDVSVTVVQSLIADPNTPPAVRLYLYDRVPVSSAPTIFPVEGVAQGPKDAGHFGHLAQLYFEQQKNGASGVEARARAALPMLSNVSVRTNLLFAPTFAALSPNQKWSNAEIQRIGAILLATNPQAANSWLARLRSDLKPKLEHDPALSALFLLGQIRGLPAANGPVPLSFSTFSSHGDINLGAIFKNLSDLLDTAPDFIDNPGVVYEKKKDLTSGDHYVMPVSVLRTNLVDGAKNGQISRVILASLLAVQTADPKTIDADLLADILKSMVAVGLNEEARQIATYVFLGVTLTGE